MCLIIHEREGVNNLIHIISALEMICLVGCSTRPFPNLGCLKSLVLVSMHFDTESSFLRNQGKIFLDNTKPGSKVTFKMNAYALGENE